MKQTITAITILLLAATSAVGQFLEDEAAIPETVQPEQSYNVPTVRLNDNSVSFQNGIYPDYYKNASAYSDMRWVRRNDSTFVDFWQNHGDSILLVLSDLSGIEWVEDQFDIYLVRYYPTVGSADPAIIPLGGMRQGAISEAPPQGNKLHLNLIYQLSHRILNQVERSEDPFMRSMAGHPLMRPGIYRRDNLAMLLALVTSQQVLGLDSTFDAYQSAFWKQRHPGRQVFEDYLLSEWILTADRPLAQWVVEEPYSSNLVSMTRPPRRQKTDQNTRKRVYVEDVPLKGQLGFSIKFGNSGRLVVDKIDYSRLAYACGLREEDVIRSVDGSRVRSHKDMIQKILAGMDEGGATVTVMREEHTLAVLIQPLDIFYDEDLYWQEDEDSLHYETPPVEDSAVVPPGPEE